MRAWLERLWYPKADRGLSHLLATPALAAASVAFRLGSLARAAPAPTRVEGAKVISVGNLTVGGAGKTPVVIFLAQLGTREGKRVAVLTRGHGRRSTAPLVFDADAMPPVDEAGDEPRLIARRCPGVRVFVGADRVRSAAAARAEGCDWLILDDGFQHRRLARDVDLVVVDDEVLFGTGHLLPWGPLREPPVAIARASIVWRRAAIDLLPRPPLHPHEVRAAHRALPLAGLSGQPVWVIAAIARSSTVVASAQQQGARVVGSDFFPDHHLFTPRELARVERAARAASAQLITTEKDLERLPDGFATPLVLDLRLLEGEPLLRSTLGLEGPRGA